MSDVSIPSSDLSTCHEIKFGSSVDHDQQHIVDHLHPSSMLTLPLRINPTSNRTSFTQLPNVLQMLHHMPTHHSHHH